uniref:Uncharacterized protein n=1 Tax=Arundo donax TaxID=35708 RepID=A0A0A9EK93_ARUDO
MSVSCNTQWLLVSGQSEHRSNHAAERHTHRQFAQKLKRKPLRSDSSDAERIKIG